MGNAIATEDAWRGAIASARGRVGTPVRAMTFLGQWRSASKPVRLRCEDGRDYVVKCSQAGKIPVNDQVVGRLGLVLGAPVGEVALVEVSADLVNMQPEMQHLSAGVCHGSVFIPHTSEREGLLHTSVTENQQRFALLAVLYGWVGASDHQFIYGNEPPHIVHSVDHGHFFPGGPDWTPESLRGAPEATLDQMIANACLFQPHELQAAGVQLAAIDDEDIALAVAAADSDWHITEDERIVLAQYLARRRYELSASLAST